MRANLVLVSPTSIRSRILKGAETEKAVTHIGRFTHVDPFEDTERLWPGRDTLIAW